MILLFVAQFCGLDQAKPLLDSDLVIAWNQAVFRLAEEEDGLLTLKGVRCAAMMHVAIHDALNRIEPKYATYASSDRVEPVDPSVAAAFAAFSVVVNQYPDSLTELRELLVRTVESSENVSAAALLGKDSAASVIKIREHDGWDSEAEYHFHPMGPGVYAEFSEHSNTPTGFVFGAGWAKAMPFMLPSQDHFRSPPPPDIQSDAYTTAFREVKEVGRDSSTTRLDDQSHLAMWWKDFVENSHNRLARDLVSKHDLDMWRTARLFALLNMSIYDAYVNVFDNKFYYNHWRPYTAIRWAEHDGNPETQADPSWNNLHHHTYAFPSYPSAHGTASAAAMRVLEDVFGKEFGFTMRTDKVDKAGPFSGKVSMDPPTRTFDSFSQAAMECSLSRVYLGIHFRYDSEEGYRLGRQIGTFGCTEFLTPVH